MIVQSTAGRFFLNPSIVGLNWVVRMGERVELRYKGDKIISWKTARKVLAPAGIKAKMAAGPYSDSEIFDGKLKTCTVYVLELTGPIPCPTTCEADLDSEPAAGDFEIIRFQPNGKRKR